MQNNLRDKHMDQLFQAILKLEDITPLWTQYYIECIWSGEALPIKQCGKCHYYLTIAKKN